MSYLIYGSFLIIYAAIVCLNHLLNKDHQKRLTEHSRHMKEYTEHLKSNDEAWDRLYDELKKLNEFRNQEIKRPPLRS